jgi:hypothetical protein
MDPHRDHVRAALAVFKTAMHRTDMDAVAAMSAAIAMYQHLEEKDRMAEATAERGHFYRGKLRPYSARAVAAIRTALSALTLALLPAFAQAGQPAESLNRFHAGAMISVGGVPVAASGALSEDLPTEGYVNRWRYVLGPPLAKALRHHFLRGPVYGQVRVAATADGTMVHEAVGLFSLELTPTDPGVAQQIAAAAPGEETLWQTMTLRPLHGGYAELLTEEPVR